MGRAYMHGWIGLPTEGEIYLEHSVPRQVRMENGQMADMERLIDEIAETTGLHVTLGRWEACDEFGEMVEAEVHVDPEDIAEVLNRLAHASAETFYDRYHKTLDASDTDFDDEACAQDFNMALHICNMQWGQLDKPMVRENYLHALHRAVDEIAGKPS